MTSFGYLDNYLTWLLDIDNNQDREEVFSLFELAEGKRGEWRQPRPLGLFSGSQEVPPTFKGKALVRGWKGGKVQTYF